MAKRDEFITIITALRAASATISDEQRKGLLRQAVQNYDLSVEEATDILQSFGLIVGGEIDYFSVLGFSIDDIQGLDESSIASRVETAHKKLYRASLNAGGRPRADGRTEEQWRTLLNHARDTLIDVEKRTTYIASLQNDIIPPTEPIIEEEVSTPDPTPQLPTESFSTEESSIVEPIPQSFPEQDGMVIIPASEFQMGSDNIEAYNDEKPVHTVYVDSFYMDQYPVTNAQYKEFLNANPRWCKPPKWYKRNKETGTCISKEYHDGDYLKHWKGNHFPRLKADHPVTWISWYAAMAYAVWVGKRLPTEAEWEKAARGGLVGNKYPWGNSIDSSKVNYSSFIAKTTSVGEYPANGYGLYDIVGNVFEWCLDKWDKDFYVQSRRDNPVSGDSIIDVVNNFTDINTSRILRGGSCFSTPQNIRVAYRSRNLPEFTCFSIGFRCVKSVTP